MAPDIPHALIEQRGHVLIVTMNRPMKGRRPVGFRTVDVGFPRQQGSDRRPVTILDGLDERYLAPLCRRADDQQQYRDD